MNITEFYETDHDRLDELFRNFQEWKRKDYPKAKTYFREFKFGLQRHIIWEEEILFPLFEGKTGMTHGPTYVMRLEHRQIGAALEALHEKVRHADPESDAQERELLALLGSHNLKEENVLYPAIDSHTTEAEVNEVFEKMNSLPEERYANCCGHGHSHQHVG